jgi:hypothetical protein
MHGANRYPCWSGCNHPSPASLPRPTSCTPTDRSLVPSCCGLTFCCPRQADDLHALTRLSADLPRCSGASWLGSNIGTSIAVIGGELRGGAAQTGRHRLTILGGDSGGGHTIAQVDVIGDASLVRRTFQSVHGTSGRCCSMKCWCKARTASFARSSDTIQVMRNDEVAVPAGTMPTAFNVAAPMRTLS